jgi:hypothetical protein
MFTSREIFTAAKIFACVERRLLSAAVALPLILISGAKGSGGASGEEASRDVA